MNDTPESNNLQLVLPLTHNPSLGNLVNARDLHAALGVRRDFSAWLKQRIEECAAIEGQDFCVVDATPNSVTGEPEYNNRRIDYALTLDLAKHLAMLQRNDVGQRVRQWFIDLEKRQRLALPFDPSDPESVLEYALGEARAAKAMRAELEVAKPKVEAFEQLMDASGTYSLSQVAKMLGTGVVRLCAALRDAGVLMHDQPNWNVPYQRQVDAARFEVKSNSVVINGETRRTYTTRVTTKGLGFIRRLLGKERVA
jgi:anti-repressor protein